MWHHSCLTQLLLSIPRSGVNHKLPGHRGTAIYVAGGPRRQHTGRRSSGTLVCVIQLAVKGENKPKMVQMGDVYHPKGKGLPGGM